MQLTEVQEGIIVRCIQQLSELVTDIKSAAKAYCNPELQNKMEETSAVIKKDIVFAATLYTVKEVCDYLKEKKKDRKTFES